MMGYYGYGMGVFGFLGMLLFFGLMVLAGVYLWRLLSQQDSQHSSKAVDIVKERYAKGEISKDEFDRLKHDLE